MTITSLYSFYESYKTLKARTTYNKKSLRKFHVLHLSILMAPQNKTTSSSGYVYELNNFTACVNTTDAPQEFHGLMRFLIQCSMSNAMTEAPVLFCEVVEEVQSSAVYNSTDEVINFNLKGSLYSINGDVINTCLNFPANTHAKPPTEIDIRTMLNEINYVVPDANLGKIVRKNLGNNGATSLIASSKSSLKK